LHTEQAKVMGGQYRTTVKGVKINGSSSPWKFGIGIDNLSEMICTALTPPKVSVDQPIYTIRNTAYSVTSVIEV